MNVRRRSPRFTNTGEASASTLNSNELEVIQPADTRSLIVPRPLFDTQANESSAVLRSPLTSLGGVIEGSGLKPYAITVHNQNTKSNLEIRLVRAETSFKYYRNDYRSYTATRYAIAAVNSPISNLTSAFSVRNVSAVYFTFQSFNPDYYYTSSDVIIRIQVRHAQYFTKGEYKIYLYVNGGSRRLVGTVSSRHLHISDPWLDFSVNPRVDRTIFHRYTYTLEFVRTL